MRELRWLLPLLGALIVGPAAAQDDERAYEEEPRDYGLPLADRTAQAVLVVPLLPDNVDSVDGAAALTRALIEGLEAREHLTVERLSDVPAIYDGNSTIAASLYMRGCPPDQELGCQLIVGEKAGVDRVVSGTSRADGARRVVTITFLGVALSELEYSFEVQLGPEDDPTLVEAVELTLEELADPYDRNQLEDETRLDGAELDRRRRQKERAAMRVLDLVLPDSAYQPLEGSLTVRRERISEEDLAAQDDAELVSTVWEDAGLTKAQYVRWHNSRLDLDTWKLRAANHFLQPIIGIELGSLFGPLELDFAGNYIFEQDDPRNVADSVSTLQPRRGSGFSMGLTLGFGLTTFLDFEFTGTMTFSRLNVILQKYEFGDEPGSIEADPIPIESGSQIRTYGMAWKLRFYPVAVWRVKPTLAGGFAMMLWPDLGNPERYEFSGPWYWAPSERYNDQAFLIEPGLVVEFTPHVALTANLPIAISARPPQARVFTVDPYPDSALLDAYVETPALPKPGYVGIRIGLQIRPTKPRFPEPPEKDLIDDGI